MNLPFEVPAAVQGVGGIAAIGIIIGMWKNIKIYIIKIYSLVVVRMELMDHQLSGAAQQYLWNNFSCSPLGQKRFTGSNSYIRPIERNQLVAYEKIPGEPTIWWKGFRFLIVSAGGGGPNPAGSISISFIRGMFKKDDFIIKSINMMNDSSSGNDWRDSDRFFIERMTGTVGLIGNNSADATSVEVASDNGELEKLMSRPVGWTRDELGQPNKESAMNYLSLKPDQIALLHEFILWRDSEKWFKSRSIPWKFGCMFHGGAGVGKTAYVRALGQELRMPIFSFDMPTMNNQDFNSAWSRLMDRTPCIGLFEDIDGVFHGRENIAVNGLNQGISFDCFLNTLDGVENTDGVIIIITTNDMTKVDPAIGNATNGDGMSTRPGRIDRLVEFTQLDADGREKMAGRICEGLERKDWESLLADGHKDTGAQFQERCCRLANGLFWKDRLVEIENKTSKEPTLEPQMIKTAS